MALQKVVAPQPDLVSLRLLVVDDNAVNRSVAVGILEKQGHRISFACDGREAVAAARRERFDFILMDVQMPVLDGFAATARIREHEANSARRTPIIAMTAHAGKDDRAKCLAAGMDEYVSKPISKTKLKAAMEVALGEAASTVIEPPTLPSPNEFSCAPLLAQFDGDLELFSRVAGLFKENTPLLFAGLREALLNQDHAATMRSAQTLAGSLANVGASRAAQLAREIENAAENKTLPKTETCVSELSDEIHIVLAGLDRALSAGPLVCT